MSSHRTALVWFRRDLRLADNPALLFAHANASRILPIFIYSPEEEGSWPPGAASRWWLHHSLLSLSSSLEQRGSRLVLQRGDTLATLRALIKTSGATLVTWNRLYEPASIARDKRIKAALAEDGFEVASHNAALLIEPWTLHNAQGQPYRVFTPFWRLAETRLSAIPAPAPAPKRLDNPDTAGQGTGMRTVCLNELELLPRIAWDTGLAANWTPGEAGALRQLQQFSNAASDYELLRNRPDRPGTSRLSPYLHFGELGPRQILAQLQIGGATAAAENSLATFRRELGWREFAHHLLFHFPQTAEQPMDPRFNELRWRDDTGLLRAWQLGQTGYPIVDAGMRELWHTGWMHNRVRMIVASLLTKNLQTHWLKGARWFWDTLVDADLANNSLGWQWTAGCGADAAPYYRIFNPVLQAEKFDPQRTYIRRWVPQLAALPDKWIVQPWAAPAEVLAAAKVELGKTYPLPIVDLKHSRAAALAAYTATRE
ncbi:MAG TPA: deoxyribodipyrimidine photo-lyase [Steroidobacteraceae bacterium]|jgi:deoxyribodipyrimidine photo-lyase